MSVAAVVAFSATTAFSLFERRRRKGGRSSRHASSSSTLSSSTASGAFVPGEFFPERAPDAVVRHYCKELVDDAAFEEVPTVVDKQDQGTPDEWLPRHASLVRLTGRHPFNCEAPLKQLFDKGFITPTSLHYVRNHGAAPKIAWDDHVVHFGGMVPNRLQLKMKDIVALPTHSLPVTLVCCGNRRKEQNMIKQTKGFNWGAAGVSTGVWTGVRLSVLLRMAGVCSVDDFPAGMHIRFASESDLGGDKLPSGVYGTSVPLEKALDDTQDIVVAYMYNGKLLTPDHGFPVRVIIPGYIGGRMIKWMTNIDLIDTCSQDYYHFFDNRVLPPHVDAELAMAEGWWYKPEYICNDLSVNSAIARPDHDEELQLVAGATYACQGYAYTGGGRKITRVEVSLDSGVSWLLATVHVHEKPSRTGKYWCWVFWEVALPHAGLAGAPELVLRAWDEGHAVQPDKPTWNLMGMLNNPWFRVKVHRTTAPGAEAGTLPRVRFEHPTLAGNQNGGWMMRLKEHPALIAPGAFNDHVDAPDAAAAAATVTAAPADTDAAAVPAVFDPSKPSFSLAEVEQHASAESAWMVVNDKVYDATPFLQAHPGGKESILISAGTDCTEEFGAIHSQKAWKMLDDYFIGQLRPEGAAAATAAPAAPVAVAVPTGPLIALDPKKKIPFTLTKRVELSPDTLLLRFGLQSPQHVLGLPVGQHMFFSAKVDGKLVMRAYTPTSSDHDVGHFDLVVKVYRPQLPQFPDGGIMSQHLGRMQVGDAIDVKGPLGHVHYVGKGELLLGEARHAVTSFAMLCAGTGITPIYQVLCAVLRDPNDLTAIHVIFANRREVDVLLKSELDMLARAHPTRLHLHYILSQPADAAAWLAGDGGAATRSVGQVGGALVADKVPPHAAGRFALLCGPPGFLTQACDPALEALGYTKDARVYF